MYCTRCKFVGDWILYNEKWNEIAEEENYPPRPYPSYFLLAHSFLTQSRRELLL